MTYEGVQELAERYGYCAVTLATAVRALMRSTQAGLPEILAMFEEHGRTSRMVGADPNEALRRLVGDLGLVIAKQRAADASSRLEAMDRALRDRHRAEPKPKPKRQSAASRLSKLGRW